MTSLSSVLDLAERAGVREGERGGEEMYLSRENLRLLCIENGWFTDGSNEQYEELFYANEMGCPVEELATIIWLCSSADCFRRDILWALRKAKGAEAEGERG